MSSCIGCGREIEWITTTTGKRMPLDTEKLWVVVDENAAAIRTVVLEDGRVVRARLAATGEPGMVAAKESHFATCYQADRFRKTR